MQSRFLISALAAAALLQGGIASAQTLNSPGTAGTVVSPNGSAGSATTGAASAPPPSVHPAPVPRSAPSPYTSLPGDNPSAPGFPGKVGR